MKIGSLFSGYGGLDMGVQSVLGGDVVWHVEYDKAPSRILAHHHPHIPNHGDVTAVDFTSIEPVDVLTGGYPCQPFSTAGKRKGTDDERHLWPHVLRAIRDMEPRIVVLENVRGHLSLGFDVVLADLASVGWSAEWGIVRASDTGAPHQRARLFIVAIRHARHDARSTEQWKQSDSKTGGLVQPDQNTAHAAHLRHEWRGVAWKWRGRPQNSSGAAADASGERHGRGKDAGMVGRLLQSTAKDREGCGPTDSTREVAGDRSATPTTNAQLHGFDGDAIRRGTSAGQEKRRVRESERRDPQAWGEYGPAIARWEHVTGRPAPAPTKPGRTSKPQLNPAFVEWMMGLPAGWVTDPAIGISRNDQLKALGNGVVPRQAALAVSLLTEQAAAA